MIQVLGFIFIVLAACALIAWLIFAPILRYFGLYGGADESIEDPNEMLTLYTFRDQSKLPIVKVELERLGIPYYIHNEHGSTVFGAYLPYAEQMRVQVPRRHSRAAQIALAKLFN